MKISATIVKLSSKRDNYARVKFTFGEGSFAPSQFAWGWLNVPQKVGHSEELSLEQFGGFEFFKSEMEDGKVANGFKIKGGV